jgi:hypothetical protein
MKYCTKQNRYKTTTGNSKRTHLNGFFQPNAFHAKPYPCNVLIICCHLKNRLFCDLLYAKQTHLLEQADVRQLQMWSHLIRRGAFAP